MKQNKAEPKAPVCRITVDEKLERNLIRILIATLKPDKEIFNDEVQYWNEEIKELVKPDTYKHVFGITGGSANKWNWDDLSEGQVFLAGEFKVYSERNTQNLFIRNPGRRNFKRIDSIIKDNIKKKYLKALQGGGHYGKAD